LDDLHRIRKEKAEKSQTTASRDAKRALSRPGKGHLRTKQRGGGEEKTGAGVAAGLLVFVCRKRVNWGAGSLERRRGLEVRKSNREVNSTEKVES